MKRLPSYRCWKTRDVGYVFYNGQKIYFPGKFNSRESRTAYANFLTALRAGLCAQFLTWAQTYYRKHGRSTGSYERFATAVVPPLLERLHSKKVDEVGRADLRAVQDALIARGLARSTVNDRIRFAKQIFKWGVENDLVKPETFARIAALKGLVAGRSPAREPEPVSAVADVVVEKTAAFASQTVADLIFVLRRTGMRPGEAFRMRWRDVDRSGDVWLYYPSEWKTEHWPTRRPVGGAGSRSFGAIRRQVARRADFLAARRRSRTLRRPKRRRVRSGRAADRADGGGVRQE